MTKSQPYSSVFRPPQLAEDLLIRVKWIHAVLEDAQGLPLDAFVEIFDPTQPDVEQTIGAWQTMAVAYLAYAKRHTGLTPTDKRAAFLLLLCRTTGKPLPPDLQHSEAVRLWEELGELYDSFS